MNEFERLSKFYPFNDEVLARVEREATRQQDLTWPEYRRRFNIPDPLIYSPTDGKPVEVIDIKPRDYEDVLVYHQPMGCPLDSNISLHIATVAGILPQYRVIGIGNPGPPGRGYGKLSLQDIFRVWNDDLGPTVAPTLQYVNAQGVESAVHAGESYGAEKAAAAAENAFKYDSQATKSLMIEPVAVIKSGIIKMGLTFRSTSQHKEKYLEPIHQRSTTHKSAEATKVSMMEYNLSLIRLSNLAIAHALGRQDFEGRVERALTVNRDLKAGISWGTESEFDRDNEREKIIKRLQIHYGEARVVDLPLRGQTHAMNLDIFLNSTIISQLLLKTE
ncbi:hypothetical protein KW794_03220 [Candidatus Saccharibacteria bacterium]|nr:hypothetical protein [Candidatus Saccharibacteria bacterium]